MLPITEDLYSPVESHPSYQYPQKGEPDEVYSDVLSSPITSTSTLTLVDDDIQRLSSDEIRQIFITKPNCLAKTLSDPSCYVDDIPDFRFFTCLPTDNLNPLAAPFVPKAPLPATLLPPKSPRLLRPATITQPRKSKWRRSFEVATRPPIEEKEVHSLIIVAAEAWEPEQLAELAQEFCWRFAEATQDDLEAILVFMLRLHWQFKHMKSEKIADKFEWHLKEFILGTFSSIWDANADCEAISYDNANPQVINAARMLTVAIGQSFERGFLDTRDIHNCLKVLIPNFVSVEHAEAVAALFHHIGPRYWFEHPDGRGHLQDFQRAFSYIMQRLEGKMSLLNQPRSHDQLSTLMHTVAEQTMEIDEQMMIRAQMQFQQLPPPPTSWVPSKAEEEDEAPERSMSTIMTL
ncbi:hypothetical protein C0995_016147 [Termitomyces sp. Mi166|nr:hypothetical protein C0995_016147 [Termitomyces sp. Mi166\